MTIKLAFPLLSSAAIGLSLLLSSCGSRYNPQTRIEKNQSIYNALSVKDQELVSQGKIEEGMSSQAVFLALGSPDRRVEGQSNGVTTMRWDYTELTPIYSNRFYSYGGWGFGRGYGRCRRGYGGFGYSPSVNYVPVRAGTVWFESDRVRSWERRR